MASLIDLETHTDSRGSLTVIEKNIPFPIRRVFYIYGVDDSRRGGHRHHTTVQAAICLQGSCRIFCDDSHEKDEFLLDRPNKCLLLNPEDWHVMYDFTPDAILLVLASTEFDSSDYIYESYGE